MRFSLTVASVLAAAGLVSATREFISTCPLARPVVGARLTLITQTPPALEARRGELAILEPDNNAYIGTPFAFQYIDNVSPAVPSPTHRAYGCRRD